jgi:two-component system, cell cycle sensor histidine kinase and response regulator CckA
VLSAAKTAPSPGPIHVLLVGNKEEDFFLIREILDRSNDRLIAHLDHAHSVKQAGEMLRQSPYDLILFEHDAGDPQAVRLMTDVLRAGKSVPFILLAENADERSVVDAINGGVWNYIAKSQLDGATLVRTIRGSLAVHTLQKEQESAEESLRKLWGAVEQSPDMVMITDKHGIIEYVNPAFESLTEFSRDDLHGKTPSLLKSGQQADELYQDLWSTILAGKTYRGIMANRKKNGELYYVEESITPVRDKEGEITHFICNGRDLTERLHLEAELRQAQKMDAIGQLAGGVAHDFNNLLTIISSYAELALDSVEQDSPLESKLHEILLAARRAAELTRQLLAFSRKQPQALRVLEMNPVIARIANTLPRLIGEDIQFSFAPGQGLGQVRADPLQVEQILMNLAANARDAMPQGGHFRIETANVALDEQYIHCKNAAIPVGRYVQITVSDDGSGIAPKDMPHIFEPFYTTKPPGEGTGLGLATVYGIVKQNKGFIWAYSEPEIGTIFKIYFPCVSAAVVSPEPQNARPERALRGSETILLVEDEPAVRDCTAQFLKQQGYTVLEAKDGLEALAVVGSFHDKIHLVVTDVVMPQMSGGQLAKELCTLRPDARLLFVSGYAGKTVLDHNVFDLETNFLQKPYTLKQLSGKVRAALDRQNTTLAVH